MAPLALMATLIASSCVDDDFADGQFLCSPTGGTDECPPGMKCDASGRCRHPADPGDACTPKTCEELAPLCGTRDDGCGAILDCGCWPPLWCGGAGVTGECGCLPEQTVERFAGALYDDGTIGTVAWSDPESATLSDDARATADLADADVTNYLRAADFRFELPATAVVQGIELSVERSADVSDVVSDHEVRVAVDGALLPKVFVDGATWGSSDAVVGYGGETDLWDSAETITPALVNQTNFGVAIAATASGGAAQARVDSVRVKVYFANPTCPETRH
jgi:hypothetical protein